MAESRSERSPAVEASQLLRGFGARDRDLRGDGRRGFRIVTFQFVEGPLNVR